MSRNRSDKVIFEIHKGAKFTTQKSSSLCTDKSSPVRDMSPDIRLRNGVNWQTMYGTWDFAWISLITHRIDF